MTKKAKIILLIITILCCCTSFVFADTTANTHFEVVDKTKCVINFNENGSFEKQIVTYDENSVTLGLTINNTANPTTEKTKSEIFLVIDNSLSLKESISDTETRKDRIYASAKTLATKLFEADSTFKIGVISFSSSSDINKEGTIEDATLKQALTNNSQEVLNAIESINDDNFGSRTNIEAGLELANTNFSSENTKKYVILLTDGIPNDDIHGNTLQYSDIVMENTKNKLIELNQKNINLISVLIGIGQSVEPTTGKTFAAMAEQVFGTTTNPTAGSYYFINDENIKNIVENDVFNDIEIIPGTSLTNVIVKDYFPQEIIDNFNFEYVASPNIGTVDTEIDKNTNCITWKIDLLEAGKEGSLQYKLTLKDNFNKEILDKILPTNEKVNITDDQGDNKTSTDSPKVKVTEPVVEPTPTPTATPTATPTPDNTIIPDKELPKTGTNAFIIISAILAISSIGTFEYIKYKKQN